jgi:uroporphyrinogen decarboxylase
MIRIILVVLFLSVWVRTALALRLYPYNSPFKVVPSEANLLLRTLKGEDVERAPVWLMRQAGRYMSDFRAYSSKYPFRMRSETPEMAVELSLQPWRAFQTDAVIMFSDILTPLPAMGIDFNIISGFGPKIDRAIRTASDVAAMTPMHDVENQVPFLGPTLRALRKETEGKTTLIGFIGAPFTLCAYAIEGGQSKQCLHVKRLMLEQPSVVHSFLSKVADALCAYASYQIDSGAQVIQLFESWAHHLDEDLWRVFAEPYAERVASYLKMNYPYVPIVYFAYGGSAYLDAQVNMSVDALGVDHFISMGTARAILDSIFDNENGDDGRYIEKGCPKWNRNRNSIVLMGNVDPAVLLGSEASVRTSVKNCLLSGSNTKGNGRGRHVLNLGHGVDKATPENNVAVFVNEARSFRY